MKRGNTLDLAAPPVINVRRCESRTVQQRAVTLAEEMIRAAGHMPACEGDWEDRVADAVDWANLHRRDTETEADTNAVLRVVAQRSHLTYWKF